MDLDSFVQIGEIDPAADFIAREQNVLAELDGEINFDEEPTLLNQEPIEVPDPVSNDENLDIINAGNDSGLVSSINGSSNNITNGHMNGFSEVYTEPESIGRWRAASIKMLQEKDEEESKRKQELLDLAKKELEEWYDQYNDQLNKTKTNNRNSEAEWINERDAEIEGKEWEKIAKMCDFNPKPNQKNIKDTSRMRSLLLHLKQKPPMSSC